MTSRSAGYSADEDILLCKIYLDISQDLIIGINQSRDQFWDRVANAYNSEKLESGEIRNKRSLQSRMQTIEKVVRKLNGCIRQVENLNPSGASDKDILIQAKTLFMQDSSLKKGFKFDHVWNMMKDFGKFNDGDEGRKKSRNDTFAYVSSESETPTPDSPIVSSPNLSSFSLNLNEDVASGSTSLQRPSGVKKAKMKRKINDNYIKMVTDHNAQLVASMNESNEAKNKASRVKKKAAAVRRYVEENKVLFMDMSYITNPAIREHILQEQTRILERRSQQIPQPQPQSQPQPQPQQSSAPFTQFFNDFNVPGDGLPDY